MKMSSLGLMAAALVLLGSPTLAQTASTLSVTDATVTTRTLCETLDGNGNLTPCLQAEAATAAAQGTGNSTLSSIAASTKPVTSFGAVTVGTAFTPGLGIAAICNTAWNGALRRRRVVDHRAHGRWLQPVRLRRRVCRLSW